MTKIDRDLIAGTCELYPESLKKFICEEELGELAQAISKVMRYKISGPDDSITSISGRSTNEAEEIADVMLCIKYLQYYDSISDEEIQQWIKYKQKRQMIRDYQYMQEHGLSTKNLNYYQRCKEAYDAEKLYEGESKKPISDE